MTETRYELFAGGVFIRSYLNGDEATTAARSSGYDAVVEKVTRAVIYKTGFRPCPVCDGLVDTYLETHEWRTCDRCEEGWVRA